LHRAVVGSWCAQLRPRNPYCATYIPDAPIVGFAFDAQIGVHAFGSDRKVHFHAKPNGLAFVPAGCDVYSQSNLGGEYLKITFKHDHGEEWPWTHRFSNFADIAAIDAAQQLRRQLLATPCFDELLCEQYVHALKERTARVLSGTLVRPAAGSWMTPQRLRLVDELIEARLDAKVTVEELAEALRLSVGLFCRAFRAGIGKHPTTTSLTAVFRARERFCRALPQI